MKNADSLLGYEGAIGRTHIDRPRQNVGEEYEVLRFERDGTGYHEFYRGKWDGQSFWRDDSLYIDDYRLFEIKGFVGALRAAVPYYDSYGITEISREQWKKLGTLISCDGGNAQELYQELSERADEVFKKHDCFTILGL